MKKYSLTAIISLLAGVNTAWADGELEITSIEELIDFRDKLNTYGTNADAEVKLIADIDFTEFGIE